MKKALTVLFGLYIGFARAYAQDKPTSNTLEQMIERVEVTQGSIDISQKLIDQAQGYIRDMRDRVARTKEIAANRERYSRMIESIEAKYEKRDFDAAFDEASKLLRDLGGNGDDYPILSKKVEELMINADVLRLINRIHQINTINIDRETSRVTQDGEITKTIIAEIRKVMSKYPNSLKAQLLIGETALCIVLDEPQRLSIGEEAYMRAVRLDPKNVEALLLLADVYRQSFKNQERIKYLKRAFELDPSADIHNRLGWAYSDCKDLNQAIKHFQSAIKLDPKPEYYCNMGQAYSRNGRFNEAIDVFLEARKRFPKTRNENFAQSQLADTYYKKGDLAHAEAEYRQMVRRSPKNLHNNYNLAQVLYERGRYNDAKKYFQIVLELTDSKWFVSNANAYLRDIQERRDRQRRNPSLFLRN